MSTLRLATAMHPGRIRRIVNWGLGECWVEARGWRKQNNRVEVSRVYWPRTNRTRTPVWYVSGVNPHV